MIDAIPTLPTGNVKPSSLPGKAAAKADQETPASAAQSGAASGPVRPQGGSSRPEPSASGEAEAERREPVPKGGLSQVVESLNSYLQNSKRALEFSVDDGTGQVVIKVMDADRKEVIRQIPPEHAIKLMERLREGGDMNGTGLNERA